MKKIITLLLTTLATFSYAASTQDSLETTAEVENSCVLKYEDLNFGLWNAFGTQDKNFEIGIKCNPGVSYTLNGEMAPLITAPNGVGVFNFIFPMRKSPNPHPTQYLGYRIMILNPNGLGSEVTFGNGGLSESKVQTYNVKGIGSGDFQSLPFIGKLYGYSQGSRYVIVEPGTYIAQYNLTVSY